MKKMNNKEYTRRFNNFIVDRMVWSPIPKEKHLDRLNSEEKPTFFTANSLDAPVIVPPSNSSLETIAELECVESAVNYTQAAKSIENAYDDDFIWAYIELLNENGLKMDRRILEDLAQEVGHLIIKLKYRYNRPRPYQLADVHGFSFMKMDSETAKTPSFPSGHTCQAHVLANWLGNKYPELKESFLDIANMVEMSRIIGGHHFPSDNTYGRLVANWISSTFK